MAYIYGQNNVLVNFYSNKITILFTNFFPVSKQVFPSSLSILPPT